MSPAEHVPLPRLCTMARTVLAHRPAGLATDFDGTLSPIVPDPGQARITPAARTALARLAKQLDLVAVISGRRVQDVRALTGVDSLTYVGNHGLETWEHGRASPLPAAVPFVDLIQRASREVEARLTQPGIIVEHKGVTASIHYRQAPQPAIARAAILEAIAAAPSARRLRVSEGRMVVNLLPPVEANKGSALRHLVDQYRLRGIVYLGDDVTDVDAFAALRDLRQHGLATLAVAVASPESPPTVLALADYAIASPAQVAALLQCLCQRRGAIDRPPLEEPGEVL